MKPLVSVIIPVYKTEEYLTQCVDSVLKQTYQNIEIILVDDGSPDNSHALCDGYARQDNRVKVIHRENGGLSAARNTGKAAANGQYLTFLDSDDLLAPETIEHMVGLAQKEQAQLVKIGNVRKKDIADCVPVHKDYTVATGVQVLHSIYCSPPQIISSCGKLYEAVLFEDLDFPEGLYYEDEYTTPRIYSRTDKVVLSNSELYFYMQRENESILRGSLSEKKIRDSIFVTRDRIAFLEQKGFNKLAKEAVKDHYLNLCKHIRGAKNVPSLTDVYGQLLIQRKQFVFQHPLAVGAVKLKQTLSRIKHSIWK